MGAREAYHHGNLRQALVDAALAILAEEGPNGLSLRAVARRAGVSQSAPYHHFADKEALVAEICRLGFEELGRRLAAAQVGHATATARLRAMGEAYLRFALERTDLFGIMWGGKGLIADKSCYDELTDAANDAFAQLLQVIVDGTAAGEFVEGDPIDLAIGTWSAVHGAASIVLDGALDNPRMRALEVTAERLGRASMTRLLEGLARRER